MSNANRMSEYFAEIEKVASKDRLQAIKLQNEHLKAFRKPFASDTPITEEGLSSCLFLSSGPSIPLDDDYQGGFTFIDGVTYDDNGNKIDFPDEDEDFGCI